MQENTAVGNALKETLTTEAHARNQKYCSRRCLFECMPTANTSIELKVADLLKSVSNIKKHYPFHSFSIDFALPDLKIFIECDGRYWHSLPGVQMRDAIKDRRAKEEGWLMIRLPEDLINNDLSSCKARIDQAIASRPTFSV